MSSLIGRTGMQSPTSATGIGSPSGIQGNKIPRGYKMGQMAQYTPEQAQLFQSMFGQVGPNSYLSKLAGGDEDIFNQIEAPAFRQFSGLQGNLASRFSGMGGVGARRTSGFQNTMGEAASNFAQDLAARRQGLQQSAIQQLGQMSHQLLSERPYEQFLTKKQQPFWKQLLMGAAGGAAGGLGLAGGEFLGNNLFGSNQSEAQPSFEGYM